MSSGSRSLINNRLANVGTASTPESKQASSIFHIPVPELIWHLRSSFLASDFDNVQEVLLSREADLTTRLRELQMEVENGRNECGLMEKNYQELALEKLEIEYELNKCQIECDELKEKVTQSGEDHRICSHKEKLYTDRASRVEERHAKLSDEFCKKESERKEMIFKLRKEIAESKDAKSKLEADVEAWKLKFRDLDSRVLRLERYTAMILEKDPVLRRRIEEKVLGLEGLFPRKLLGGKESVPNDGCLLIAPENIDTIPSTGSTHSPENTNIEMKEDPHSRGMDCNDKVSTGEQYHFEIDDPEKMMASSLAVNEKSRFEEVIDISDAEHPMPLGSTPLGCVSNTCASEIGLDKKEKFSEKLPEQILAFRSGEEKISCLDNSLSSTTLKRNHPSCFDSDESDGDGVQIVKRKIRKIKDFTDDVKSAYVDQCIPVFIQQCGKKAEVNNDCQSLSSSSDSDSSVSGSDTSDSFMNNFIATLRTNMDHKSPGANKGGVGQTWIEQGQLFGHCEQCCEREISLAKFLIDGDWQHHPKVC